MPLIIRTEPGRWLTVGGEIIEIELRDFAYWHGHRVGSPDATIYWHDDGECQSDRSLDLFERIDL